MKSGVSTSNLGGGFEFHGLSMIAPTVEDFAADFWRDAGHDGQRRVAVVGVEVMSNEACSHLDGRLGERVETLPLLCCDARKRVDGFERGGRGRNEHSWSKGRRNGRGIGVGSLGAVSLIRSASSLWDPR